MIQPPLSIQIISSIGALCCLLAYVGHQLHWMDAKKVLYNVLNVIGAGILAYIALRPFQAGFVIMEVVWTGVSLFALIKSLHRKNI
jgi:hypothetical protein